MLDVALAPKMHDLLGGTKSDGICCMHSKVVCEGPHNLQYAKWGGYCLQKPQYTISRLKQGGQMLIHLMLDTTEQKALHT
jgi:hypothetical protein